MMRAMICVRHVSKSLQGKRILESISLTLKTGQTHVLLGSSGSGKSTLLRVIAGLIQPDEGQVFLGSNEMRPDTQRQLAHNLGYVIQEGGLFPHLSAERNITLAARTLHWGQKRIDERLAELSELVGLERPLLKRYPVELSGGQRQRVGLMRASFLGPQFMLLDEPLGALDPVVRSSLQHELKTIFNRLKTTVVIVTHDVAEAAFFGHTVSLIKEGRVLQHGPLEELVDHPKDPFVTTFLNAQRGWSGF